MSESTDAPTQTAKTSITAEEKVPPQLRQIAAELDKLPPFEVVSGYILGQSRALATQLVPMYEKIRAGVGKNAELPKQIDTPEQAELVERCLRNLALAIAAQLDKVKSPLKKAYYAKWMDFYVLHLIFANLLHLKPKAHEIAVQNDNEQSAADSTTTEQAESPTSTPEPTQRCEEEVSQAQQQEATPPVSSPPSAPAAAANNNEQPAAETSVEKPQPLPAPRRSTRRNNKKQH